MQAAEEERTGSSPRRRGSSVDPHVPGVGVAVLPAQAGVFRPLARRGGRSSCPPRAGGGLPGSAPVVSRRRMSSPRRRGSSATNLAVLVGIVVLPAQAGVFRAAPAGRSARRRPPRAGGGLPRAGDVRSTCVMSSPRRRGSSAVVVRGPPLHLVLPAQAGVFRRARGAATSRVRPPRAGGGLPRSQAYICVPKSSSPRRRGSSGGLRAHRWPRGVLPAQAGVFLPIPDRVGPLMGPPRAGGGLPGAQVGVGFDGASSPRRRGSSVLLARRRPAALVLPAQAGVFRSATPTPPAAACPPRAGGGLPRTPRLSGMIFASSPRRRGSSGADGRLRGRPLVLPAQAGVFRHRGAHRHGRCRPPRAGGGLPAAFLALTAPTKSSPRRRGSSVVGILGHLAVVVLPAQAGVFRGLLGRLRGPDRPPRAGGGLPAISCRFWASLKSSPRRRGSSLDPAVLADAPVVLPAQAGVFRASRTAWSWVTGPPRAGGGLPGSLTTWTRWPQSSPRRRGSSAGRGRGAVAAQVLPAQAGVFRRLLRSRPAT